MDCCEFVDMLIDYCESCLPEDVRCRFEEHLAQCSCCQSVARTYRRVSELAGALRVDEMPEEHRQRLRLALRERLARDGIECP
jgi:anti-sigma factor RsiW